MEEEAVLGVSRDKTGAVLSPFDETLPGIEIDIGADFFAAVAFHAIILEEDADIALEDVEALRHVGGVIGGDGIDAGGLAESEGDQKGEGKWGRFFCRQIKKWPGVA
jgi:hypothetical protein